MDSFELNKIAGALLAALLVAVGLKEIAHVVYDRPKLETPGYEIVVAEADDAGAQTQEVQEEEPAVPIGQLLQTASLDNGKRLIRRCTACHVFEKGGNNRVGPPMWEIVGRQVASVEGFSYSNALEERGGVWSYEFLDCFLENPKGCVEGTKMVYAGLKKPEDRADLILYLRSLSDNPQPLPEEAAAVETEANPDKG